MRLRQPVTGEVARIAPPNIPEHCLRLSAKLLSLRSALPVRVASLFRQTRCAWQGGFCVYGIGAWIVHAGFFWVTVPFQPGEKRVTSVIRITGQLFGIMTFAGGWRHPHAAVHPVRSWSSRQCAKAAPVAHGEMYGAGLTSGNAD